MNEYDTNRIYDIAKSINYKKTSEPSKADCYVLNTCHIREKATDKVYHDIGRIKKSFKNKKKPIVIVTGCVAQAEGDILLEKLSDLTISGSKIIVFSQFTSFLYILKKRITKQIPNLKVLELTGSTRNRTLPVENFETFAGPAVILASLKAAVCTSAL